MFAVSLILFAYLFYLIYQFQTYGWWVVKWHTHLAFPVLLFMAGAWVIKLMEIVFKSLFAKALERWFFICWILGVVELLLMATGIGVILGDAPWGRYVGTAMVPQKTNILHTWTPGIDVSIEKAEFIYRRKINTLGLADYEWSKQKDSTIFRVLCLGDSFTEGDAVQYDESYVAHLRRIWTEKNGKSVEILNGGVCGSDPFYNYYHYKEVLSAYRPDFIIQTISSHDLMNDLEQRGGLERFENYGSFYRKPFRIWQLFYTANYTSRIIIQFSARLFLLLRYHLFGCSQRKYDIAVGLLLDAYQTEVAKNGSQILWVFFPSIAEIYRKKYFHDMSAIKADLDKKNLPYLDLLDCYLENTEQGAKAELFYWKIDHHHNARGYQMMAECIYKGLTDIGFQ